MPVIQDSDFLVPKPLTVFEGVVARVPVQHNFHSLLKNIYCEPHRYYHGVYHIAQMMNLHHIITKLYGITFSYNDETVLNSAALYHDSILSPVVKDNEIKSNNLWLLHRSKSGPYSPQQMHETELVSKLILQTIDHFSDRDYDDLTEWFIGLDLASLANPNAVFKRNTMALRAEYSNLTDEEWMIGRGGFLKKIIANTGGKIYRHPIMHELFEARALENILESED